MKLLKYIYFFIFLTQLTRGGTIDSLEVCLKKAADKDKPQILYCIATSYVTSSPQKSIEYAQLAAESALANKNYMLLGKAYNVIGIGFRKQGLFNRALEYYKKAFDIFTKLKQKDYLASILNNIGNIYLSNGDYDNALDFLIKSLEIEEQIGRKPDIAISLNNIANVYSKLEYYDKARNYLANALEIANETHNQAVLALTLTNMGDLYAKTNYIVDARENYLKAIAIFKQIDDKQALAVNYGNLSDIAHKSGNLTESLNYLNQSLEISNEIGDWTGIAQAEYKIANTFITAGNCTEALIHLKQSRKLASQYHLKEIEGDIAFAYSKLYEKLKKPYLALYYLKKYNSLKDTIFYDNLKDKIAEMQVKYDFQKQEHEIGSLKKDNKIKSLELQKQRSYRQLYAIISVLVCGLLVFTFVIYMMKKRTTGLLEENNRQLEEANTLLKESEKNLKELNATKDKFFSIIAHDIRSPLSSFLGLAEVLANDSTLLEEEDKQDLLHEMGKSASNINDLLDNLLQWARSQTGTIKYQPDIVYINEIVDNTIYLLKPNADKKNIEIIHEVKETSPAFADSNMVFTVLRNLVSNAIKFSYSGSKIIISAGQSDGFLEVAVRDQGIGIQKDNLDKLFRLDVHHSTVGTSDEKGTGLGLILCHEFIEKNGGSIIVESKPGSGSTFRFTLPKAYN